MVSSLKSTAVLAGALVAQVSALSKRSCSFTWTSDPGDTCESFAADWGITTAQLLSWNPSLQDSCSNFAINTNYCVESSDPVTVSATTAKTTSTTNITPQVTSTTSTKVTTGSATTSTASGPSPTQDGVAANCNNFYKVSSGDTCSSIVTKYSVSLDDFYSWNPAVGTDCSGLWLDYYVCVSVPGATTVAPSASATTTAPSGPSPTQDGITSQCNNYYKAVSGDTCANIVTKYGVSLDNFYSWNPAVGTDCSGLWLGYYYCVGVPGAVSTPVTTTTTAAATGPSPTQTGITASCNNYYKAVSGDSCSSIVSKYGVSLTDFYSWNPAVGSDCSSLWAGYYYCVSVPGAVTTHATTTTTTAAASGPSPTQAGIAANCNSYYQVASGDYCQKIVDAYKTFTLAQFYSWNPAVGTDCSSLWVGYYVCVGVKASKRAITTTF